MGQALWRDTERCETRSCPLDAASPLQENLKNRNAELPETRVVGALPRGSMSRPARI